eukprot:5244515-Pleurochrysis_carterae.AAC.1
MGEGGRTRPSSNRSAETNGCSRRTSAAAGGAVDMSCATPCDTTYTHTHTHMNTRTHPAKRSRSRSRARTHMHARTRVRTHSHGR